MKVGFIAVLGRPNVGKSSLLNAIVDYKLTITATTPHTTRNQIQVIYNDATSQMVFVDTPGIHKPHHKLGEVLNKLAYKAITDADLHLFLTPLHEALGPGDAFIIEKLPKDKSIAIITKIDRGNLQMASQKVKRLQACGFKYIVSTSIKNHKSIQGLIEFLKDHLPDGPLYYEQAAITNVSMRFITKEIIREAAITKTYDEIPHAFYVKITEFHEAPHRTKIAAIIYVAKTSQKGILIGNGGHMIKTIGTLARQRIAQILDQSIFLDLQVQVAKNWTKDKNKIPSIDS